MKFSKLIIICLIGMTLSNSILATPENMTEEDWLQSTAMPLVESTADGLFFDAPTISNFSVMIVRVLNARHEVVFKMRSQGEPVEILAGDFSNGEYSYQVKVLYKFDVPMGSGADEVTGGSTHKVGHFVIHNGVLIVPGAKLNSYWPAPGVNHIDQVTDTLLHMLGYVLTAALPEVQAQNVLNGSAGKLELNQNSPFIPPGILALNGAEQLWSMEFGKSGTSLGFPVIFHEFSLHDVLNSVEVINVDGGTGNNDSIKIAANGDITWAGASMFLDRSTQELSLGTSSTPADLNIFSSIPDIRLHSELDTAEAEIELSGANIHFWTRPTELDTWTQPFDLDTNAPTNSLSIKSDGDVQLGAGFYFNQSAIDPGLRIGGATSTPYSLQLSTVNTPEIFLQNTGSSGVQMNMLTDEFAIDMDTDGDGIRNTQNVLTIHKDAPAHSLKIQNDGDVTLADSTLFVSNSAKRMSMGTTSTPGVFTIYDNAPSIYMRDTNGASEMLIENNNGIVALKGRELGQAIMKSIFTYSVSAPAKSVEILANGDVQFANSALFLDAADGELALGTTLTPGDFTIYADAPNIWLHDEVVSSEVRIELAGSYMHFQSRGLENNAFKDVFSYHAGAPADSLNIDIFGNVKLGANFFLKQDGVNPSLNIGGNTPSPYTLQLSSGNAAGVMLKQNNVGGALLEGGNIGWSVSMDTDGDGSIETPGVMSVSLAAPTNSFVINSAGNLGLGVINATEAMMIQRVDTGARMLLSGISNASNEAPQMIWKRARSLGGSPQAILANDNLGAFSFRGYTGSGYSGSRGFINVQATEDWTPTANGTRMLFQTTPNGSFSPVAVMEITQDGKVKINGTELNVPDYVFEKDYNLMSLDKLSAYISEEKHLPGVASAKEVNAEGLDLADSQLSLLEKVEELTLYTLQQHEELKQISSLKAENQQLKASQKELLAAYHSLQTEQTEMYQMVKQLQRGQQGSIELTRLK